jgi:hypothetical protein
VSSVIVPVARGLYLCDYHVGYQDGKDDLYGVFSTIPARRYPYTLAQMVVFARLTDGLGDTPCFVDVRHVDRGELVHTSNTHTVRFPDRTTLVRFVLTIPGCRFPYPGLYTVELMCHNTLVCDTTILLH